MPIARQIQLLLMAAAYCNGRIFKMHHHNPTERKFFKCGVMGRSSGKSGVYVCRVGSLLPIQRSIQTAKEPPKGRYSQGSNDLYISRNKSVQCCMFFGLPISSGYKEHEPNVVVNVVDAGGNLPSVVSKTVYCHQQKQARRRRRFCVFLFFFFFLQPLQ